MSKYPEIADKLMSLQEAVSHFVMNGCQLSIGGFTVSRNPMAAVYEIVRQRIKDIHLVCHSNAQGLDVLIGAGCVRRVEIAYYHITIASHRLAATRSQTEQWLKRHELVYDTLHLSFDKTVVIQYVH